MKRKIILLAAMFLMIGLIASPRRAMSGLFDIDTSGIKNAEIKETVNEPPACPNFFASPRTVTGRIADLSVTPVGVWYCKDGALQFDTQRLGRRFISLSRGEGEEECLVPIAPAKFTMGGNTYLIVAADPERFKASLAIANAAKLANTNTSNFEISATHALDCPADINYAVEMKLK